MKLMLQAVAVLLCCGGMPVHADPLSGVLTGTYGFYGDGCDEKGQGKTCGMSFEVKGEAAKALYDRIKWKAKPDACTDGLVKDSRNGLRCFKVKTEYSCDFGYSFTLHRMTNSDVAC
jgi:hypothetical protein